MPDRIVPVYRPRVTLDADLCQTETGLHVHCFNDSQLYILRRLVNYAHREIHYYTQLNDDGTYVTPSAETLDVIFALVDDLEDELMSDCEDLLEAMQCACDEIRALRMTDQGQAAMQDIPQQVEDGTLSWDVPLPIGFSGTDEDACAIGQLHWQATWELMTETILPTMRFGFDYLVPAAAAVLIGLAGGPLTIAGVYVCTELIQELLEAFYTGAEENLQNWLWTIKDEWICAVYDALVTGGGDEEALVAVRALWEASETLSVGDKLCFELVAPWTYRAAAVAWENQSTWATQVYVEDYCVICTGQDMVRFSGTFYDPGINTGLVLTQISDWEWRANWDHSDTVQAKASLCGVWFGLEGEDVSSWSLETFSTSGKFPSWIWDSDEGKYGAKKYFINLPGGAAVDVFEDVQPTLMTIDPPSEPTKIELTQCYSWGADEEPWEVFFRIVAAES